MHSDNISGKVVQLAHIPVSQWFAFIMGWLQRTKSGSVPCALPGSSSTVQIPLRDFYESYWFFSEARSGREELKFFLDRVEPEDVVYDIGAFRGAYSVALANRYRDAVAIHLFEPIRDNLESVERILSLNQLQQIRVIPKAVGHGTPMKGTFNDRDGMLRAGDTSDHLVALEVPTTSLDAYIDEVATPPSVIKLDVDGFEFNVVEGARNCLRQHAPRIWLELHPKFLAAQGRRWEDVIEFLKSHGYTRSTFFADYDLPTRADSFHVWCEK